MKVLGKFLGLGLCALVMIVGFQNCSTQDMHFTEASSTEPLVSEPSTPPPSVITDRYGDIKCATLGAVNGGSESCLDSRSGLIGHLYYLEDNREDRSQVASTLTDKFGNQIPFNAANLGSVNVLIERGHVSDTYILTRAINTPAVNFSSGFQNSDGSYLKDKNGRILIEAFALDLRGSLRLLRGQSAGFYEFAVISDDGSILEFDADKDGDYEYELNNDGYHSPKMKCHSQVVYLNGQSEIPMRFRFYQGPRETIAATLVMRRLNDPSQAGQDPDCGFTDGQSHAVAGANTRWFGASSNSAGYVPNYTTSIFASLLSRGWFVPSDEMFLLPEKLQ